MVEYKAPIAPVVVMLAVKLVCTVAILLLRVACAVTTLAAITVSAVARTLSSVAIAAVLRLALTPTRSIEVTKAASAVILAVSCVCTKVLSVLVAD